MYSSLRYFFIVLLTLFIANCSQPSITTINQTPIYLHDLEGKWIIFNYWASWCPPCLKEIPMLNQLSGQYSQNLTVLGINTERLSTEKQQQLASHYHIQYPLLESNPTPLWHLPTAVEVLPTTFIISPKGKLAYTLRGPQTTEQIVALLHLQRKNTE
ncbi:MAG: TlpA family protein disulfide reductase [Gammaproteobacteria bacterium]